MSVVMYSTLEKLSLAETSNDKDLLKDLIKNNKNMGSISERAASNSSFSEKDLQDFLNSEYREDTSVVLGICLNNNVSKSILLSILNDDGDTNEDIATAILCNSKIHQEDILEYLIHNKLAGFMPSSWLHNENIDDEFILKLIKMDEIPNKNHILCEISRNYKLNETVFMELFNDSIFEKVIHAFSENEHLTYEHFAAIISKAMILNLNNETLAKLYQDIFRYNHYKFSISNIVSLGRLNKRHAVQVRILKSRIKQEEWPLVYKNIDLFNVVDK